MTIQVFEQELFELPLLRGYRITVRHQRRRAADIVRMRGGNARDIARGRRDQIDNQRMNDAPDCLGHPPPSAQRRPGAHRFAEKRAPISPSRRAFSREQCFRIPSRVSKQRLSPLKPPYRSSSSSTTIRLCRLCSKPPYSRMHVLSASCPAWPNGV